MKKYHQKELWLKELAYLKNQALQFTTNVNEVKT